MRGRENEKNKRRGWGWRSHKLEFDNEMQHTLCELYNKSHLCGVLIQHSVFIEAAQRGVDLALVLLSLCWVAL